MAFVKKLSGLLKHLEVCHADMSKSQVCNFFSIFYHHTSSLFFSLNFIYSSILFSQLRVDLNISVRPKQTHPDFSKLEPFIEGSRDEHGRGLGTRVEVKNLNSLKAMASAIQFEFNRQV
jgi:Asp-tRNA(Asn)/Glu-tRNA(Gln) amidotransferase B subunit